MQTTEPITATAIETTPEGLVLVLGERRVRIAWDKCSPTLASATEAERLQCGAVSWRLRDSLAFA